MRSALLFVVFTRLVSRGEGTLAACYTDAPWILNARLMGQDTSTPQHHNTTATPGHHNAIKPHHHNTPQHHNTTPDSQHQEPRISGDTNTRCGGDSKEDQEEEEEEEEEAEEEGKT